MATEDLVYLFASMRITIGQDFEALVALREKLAGWLQGEALHGSLWRAGLPKTMTNVPSPTGARASPGSPLSQDVNG